MSKVAAFLTLSIDSQNGSWNVITNFLLADVILWSWEEPVIASFTVTNSVDNVSFQVANIGGAVKSISSWMSVNIAKLACSIGIKVFSGFAFILDAFMLIWTNISVLWADFASTVNKDDFSIFWGAGNTFKVQLIWIFVRSTSLASSINLLDISLEVASITDALSLISIWSRVIFTDSAGSVNQLNIGNDITWVSNAFSSSSVWMSVVTAVFASSIR
jgi:hypothetical protein